MKKIVSIIFVFSAVVFFYACESSEDISNKMDHEVPSYKVLTDSLHVHPGQTVEIKVDVSDNAGLEKLVFSYSSWSLRESVSLTDQNYPKTYTFTTTVTIPNDALTEWTEDKILNDGTTVKVTQHYHQLNLEATDINMNVRNIPVYLQVQQ
jgi:hypothetical protein